MKKIILSTALLTGLVAFSQKTGAQVRVGVNINIGEQPDWRPAGYDYAEYYYLPDVECYYYVPRRQFVYLSGNQWVFSASLPGRCRNYDLYRGNKIVVNRPNAYRYFDQDRQRYGIREDFRQARYNHEDNGYEYHDNGRHRGWYKHEGDNEHHGNGHDNHGHHDRDND